MSTRPNQRNWPWILLIATMPVLFYYPVLFMEFTQIHAEGLSVGIALMQMLSSALEGDTGMLWTTSIYGGHPIFAEGQGGFANPLHLLLAWFFSPVAAYNINQFLCMLLGACGAFGLCRHSGCGRNASTFGGLALAFSTMWIEGVNNLAVGSTMAWIPWVFWAMGLWLQRADLYSACCFGLAMALMVLSGYPQLVHGVLIYLMVYLLALLLQRRARENMWRRRRRLVATLLWAIFLCISLSAIQWLPLLELAQTSHRSGGISIIPLDNFSTEALLRGFLFTFTDPEAFPDANAAFGIVYTPAIGSLLVCLVFSLFIFFRRTPRTNAHLWATLVLAVLGFGTGGTPVFQFIYDWHLIPGLRNFRVSFTYLFVALVGFSLVCASCLDCLARLQAGGKGSGFCWQAAGRRLLLPAFWLMAWLAALAYLHVEGIFIGQYYIAGLWLLACGFALGLGWQRWLPVVAVLLLCCEILFYRIDAYDFGESSLITKPASLQSLERDGNLRDFKFADLTYNRLFALLRPKSPEVEDGFKKQLQSISPAANALWGVSSVSGNLALGLERHVLAEQLMNAELVNGDASKAGFRMLDFASVKYLTVGWHFDQPGFVDAFIDPDLQVRIVENTAVRPRFQFFDEAVFVRKLEDVADTIAGLDRPALVIEMMDGEPHVGLSQLPRGEQYFELLAERSDRYQLAISSSVPAWFFLADTNYPGWTAYLDGIETPLYSAQLLGKAVYLPAGGHMLELVFEPLSFTVGRGVTIIGVLGLAAGLLWALVYSSPAIQRVEA